MAESKVVKAADKMAEAVTDGYKKLNRALSRVLQNGGWVSQLVPDQRG